MDKKTEEEMMKVAFAVYMAIDISGLSEIKIYDDIASFMLGIAFANLLPGVLYSSRYISKVKAAKLRLLKGLKK